jgi:hypothetical protein
VRVAVGLGPAPPRDDESEVGQLVLARLLVPQDSTILLLPATIGLTDDTELVPAASSRVNTAAAGNGRTA